MTREDMVAFFDRRDEHWRRHGNDDRLRLTLDGLSRVDSLLPRFFLKKHSNIRYT